MNTSLDIVVRSTEIDVNGHVNNAKYLEYLEWGREDWYDKHGLQSKNLHAIGVITVVVKANVQFRREAVQDDQLRIQTGLQTIGNTSLTMHQIIFNQRDELVVEASIVIVTVDQLTHSKVQVPDLIRKMLP